MHCCYTDPLMQWIILYMVAYCLFSTLETFNSVAAMFHKCQHMDSALFTGTVYWTVSYLLILTSWLNMEFWSTQTYAEKGQV